MPRPIITLTTDFGLADHYVAAMKGVILNIQPRAEVVDVSHLITPFAIEEAAFVISQTYPYFPRRTVHVAVVDPGVGSERRAILVEATGQYFIGPDNGVFGLIYASEKHKVRQLTNSKYFLEKVSNTFHGRDIFSPAAAHLSAGVRPLALGPRIEDFLVPPFTKPEQTGKRSWLGTVLKVDHFGNLITNFLSAEYQALQSSPFRMRLGNRTVSRLAPNFSSCKPGELAVVPGSSGYLEVIANQDSAAQKLGCRTGSQVELTLR